MKTQTQENEIELKALYAADEKLEAAQDKLRGGTRVKHIRASILQRILEIELSVPNDKLSDSHANNL